MSSRLNLSAYNPIWHDDVCENHNRYLFLSNDEFISICLRVKISRELIKPPIIVMFVKIIIFVFRFWSNDDWLMIEWLCENF